MIQQFLPATAVGDGVTQSALFMRKLLRRLGYRSDIFAGHIPSALQGEIRPAKALSRDPNALLLFHHSMGHDHEALIEGYPGPRILVYHNITPSHYFAPESVESRYANKGRQQLADWSPLCQGAIAVSPYNARELQALGYPNVLTLPVLVDLERLAHIAAARPPWSIDPIRPLLLSVGRLVENKGQHVLIQALWHLHHSLAPRQRPQLALVGGVTSRAYADQLRAMRADFGLETEVLIPGKCPQAWLRWLYQRSQAYLCASEHEGFCMPLIEAGYFGLPALALASSNIPDTLGQSGLLLKSNDPRIFAAAVAEVLADPLLHQQLSQAARHNLRRYQAHTLMPVLGDYLNRWR